MLSCVALAAAAFAPGLSPMSMAPAMRAVAPVMQTGTLDAELVKTYPRDFKNIPTGTAYGEGADEVANKAEEDERLEAKLAILKSTLQKVADTKERPIFTTALIAGDCVIMDVIAKLGLQDKIKVIFIDTFFLFEETVSFMKEVEDYYGIKALRYQCADCKDAEEFYDKYGDDYWMTDLEDYDKKCKVFVFRPPTHFSHMSHPTFPISHIFFFSQVEPLMRSMKESDTDSWINGRRRDHGAERASLPVWEGNKVNPLAHWTFEECWNYLRKYEVPYHPLHDVGFSSLGDVQSTKKVPHETWFTYAGERSGRFEGMKAKDGSSKTECGIHSFDANAK